MESDAELDMSERQHMGVETMENIEVNFGEIMFIRKKWSLMFKCNFCERRIGKFRKFIRHTLKHIYAVDQNALEKLLQCLLNDEFEEEQHEFGEAGNEAACSNELTSNYNTEYESSNDKHESVELRLDKLKTENELCLNEMLSEIDKPHTGCDDVTDDAQSLDENVETTDDYEVLLEVESWNSMQHAELTSSEEVFVEETETGLEIEFLEPPNAHSSDAADETASNAARSVMKALPRVNKVKKQQPKKFPCDMCDMVLTSPGNLRKHRNRHLGLRTHLCSMCGKAFFTSTELNTHIRSHTGEKPFICIECGASYSTSSHLLSHRRRHANIRPYKCDTCGKAFFDKMLLKNHQQTHSDERQYKCAHCQLNFQTYNALRQHRKIHIASRQYECKYCRKDYVQFVGLHNHMKHAHKDIDFDIEIYDNT